MADQLAVEKDDAVRVAAKDAARLVLGKHDLVTLHEDLQLVAALDAKRIADLDRDDHTAKLVDLSNHSRRFHAVLLYL